MKSPRKRYEKLKREAKKLMQLGDLHNYLNKLRELHELRLSTLGLKA